MKALTARERGERHLREAGYSKFRDGGDIHADEAADKRMISKAIHEHDDQMHGGKHTHLKLRRGGPVHGEKPHGRPDRRARGGDVHDQPHDAMGNVNANSARARGGRLGGKHKTIININAAQKGDPAREQMAHQAGVQQGAQMGARAVAARMGGGAGGPPMAPPRPPMMPGAMPAAPAPGGAPPGAAMAPPRPPGPPGMMARGGAMRDGRGRFVGGAV